MPNPGPASSTTEHPIGGGGTPAYVGGAGGAVGFYQDPFGGGAVTQPLGNAQAAIARGSACGFVATFSLTNSPNSVATISTVTTAMTLVGGTGAPVTIATTDLLFINKPTAQAGLGVGNIAVSSAGVAVVSFVNASATNFITPTASETYGVVALRGFGRLTTVITPASVAANTTAEQQFAVTGLRAGDLVQVSKPTNQLGLDIAGCRVVSNNLLGVTFLNVTAGPLTPTAGETYGIISLGGIDAGNNDVLYQITGSPGSLATTTTAQRTLAVSNVAVTDVVVGIQKPTTQAGLLVGSALVSAAGVVGVTFANVTAGTLTPTANEVYAAKIWRPNPVAPLVIVSQVLTPASVAANTTAEQSFTVTGLIATTPVWVNKSTPVPGLGIVGCRVTGTNNVGITFCNPTGTIITPAADTYTIGNFQMPIDAPGNSILQAAVLADQQGSVLANALRSALVATQLIAGA